MRRQLSAGVSPARYSALILAGMLAGGLLSSVVSRGDETAIWLPAGIAVSAIFLLGKKALLPVAVGAFFARWLLPGSDYLESTVTAIGDLVAAGTAASLLWLVGFRRDMSRERDIISLVFLAALGSMLISASVFASAHLYEHVGAANWVEVWALAWAGSALGVLLIVPAVLGWRSVFDWRSQPAVRRFEAAGFFLFLPLLTVFAINTELSMKYMVLPFLIWISWRFQFKGAVPATAIVLSVASWAWLNDWASFPSGYGLRSIWALQSFDTTVALTAYSVAALTISRIRATDALEEAALNLERTVAARTSELSRANADLNNAQRLGNIGSWNLDIKTGEISASEELYRIRGWDPGVSPLKFDDAVVGVIEEDVDAIRVAMKRSMSDGSPFSMEYRVHDQDSGQRFLVSRGEVLLDENGAPARLVGTTQDITRLKIAEHEHTVAESLQRSLMAQRLPDVPGAEFETRYMPATELMEVGGDWYEAISLPSGRIGIAIGDVAGHGLDAAVYMGQIRLALLAHAMEESSPANVMQKVHHLAKRLPEVHMATIAYCVYDPQDGTLTFTNAGHPPPLLIHPDGEVTFMPSGIDPPVGAFPLQRQYQESTVRMQEGSVLLMYTDGLVERRDSSIDDGLTKLRQTVIRSTQDEGVTDGSLRGLCDSVLSGMVGRQTDDDVALIAFRPQAMDVSQVVIRSAADPECLSTMRRTVRRWLAFQGVSAEEEGSVILACGEAWANVIRHAYVGAGPGDMRTTLSSADGSVTVDVADTGRWRNARAAEGGHGLALIHGLMDDVSVRHNESGTVVRMSKKLNEHRPAEETVSASEKKVGHGRTG